MNSFRRFLNFFRPKPGMVGTPPSVRPMWHDPATHALDFSQRYAVDFERVVEGRMHALNLTDNMIGHPDEARGLPWAVFHPHGVTGGSVIGEGIAINSGVVNPELFTGVYGREAGEIWAKSRLRDRIDSIIAHEVAEAETKTHAGALELAAETELPVSDGAPHPQRDGREVTMIHNITAGHFDPLAVLECRETIKKPIDMRVAWELLSQFGVIDEDGNPTLDGGKVGFDRGCVIVPWMGGQVNRVSEEFAIRLQRMTGCTLADREHGRLVEPGQLIGLTGHRPMFAGVRRMLKTMGM